MRPTVHIPVGDDQPDRGVIRPVGSTEACAGGKTFSFSRRLPGEVYAGATGIPGTTS